MPDLVLPTVIPPVVPVTPTTNTTGTSNDIICKDGDYLAEDKSCEACDSSCATCDEATSNNCISCFKYYSISGSSCSIDLTKIVKAYWLTVLIIVSVYSGIGASFGFGIISFVKVWNFVKVCEFCQILLFCQSL